MVASIGIRLKNLLNTSSLKQKFIKQNKQLFGNEIFLDQLSSTNNQKKVKIHDSWYNKLQNEFEKNYWKNLSSKVKNFYKNKVAEAAGYDKMTTIIDIYLKNGKKISGRGDFGKGSPMIPMSYDEVADKFLGCCEFAKWSTQKSKAIIETVRHLEKLKDISKLSKLLSK